MLLCRRPHKQHWLIPWGGAQKSSVQEGRFPISLSPTIPGFPPGRSPVSLTSPLMRQLVRIKASHGGHSSTRHPTWYFTARKELCIISFFADYITLCARLRQVIHFYLSRMASIHRTIYGTLLLWKSAPWLLLNSTCPINVFVPCIIPASVLDYITCVSKPVTF